MTPLFPLSHYWWFYLLFTGGILLLLALDLSLHRGGRTMPVRHAALWTVAWAALALAFSGGLYLFSAARFGAQNASRVTLEFLAGYVVEESLSIDNMFVFALVFRYFGIPRDLQHRVLFYGVLGAIVFRGIFIAGGAALVRFHWVVIVFGVFLIYTGVPHGARKGAEDRTRANPLIRWSAASRRSRRICTADRFILSGAKASRCSRRSASPCSRSRPPTSSSPSIPSPPSSASPASRCWSTPRTSSPSSACASLYSLLAGAMDRFRLLQYGIALVLVFVGLKMSLLDPLAGGRFPVGWSLAIIAGTIGGSVLLSLRARC